MTARQRIERVIVGVLRQALIDAGCGRYVVTGHGPARDYTASLCDAAAAGLNGPGQLTADAACKTELLLGLEVTAHVLPVGDLYYSQLAEWLPAAQLHGHGGRLASLYNDAQRLDTALALYFDQRADWETAVAGLQADEARELRAALDAARFRRSHPGIVPKLGARTLGIDLHT